MADIKVTVGADTKEAVDGINKVTDSLGEAQGASKAFSSSLGTLAVASGAAFAALIVGAEKAFEAFADAEKSSRQLQLALQNQGIAGKGLEKQYKDLASAISQKTGIDDDAIVSGQAILQNFLGQQEVSEGLTKTLADLSIKTGSVESAADLLGKAVQGNVRGLKTYGIELDANLTRTERIAKLSDNAALSITGLAEATNSGTGSTKKASVAFQNFLEKIGERLAPVIISASNAIADFFNTLNDNGPLLDFIFEVGKIAAIVSGALVTLFGFGAAIAKVGTAIEIATTVVKGFGLASRIAVGATGIGLLLIVAAEVYANWNKIFPVMRAVYQDFVTNIGALSTAAANLLAGVFTFNPAKIKAGLDQVKEVLANGFIETKKLREDAQEKPEVEAAQQAKKLAQAEANQKKIADLERNQVETRQANRELDLLQAQQGSDAAIELKKKEIETLKSIKDAESESDRARLELSLAENRRKQDEQFLIDIERRSEVQNEILANDSTFQNLSLAEQQAYLAEHSKALEATYLTEKQARNKAIDEEAKKRIEAHNRFLVEQERYGAAYATINAAINSEEVQGFKRGTSELLPLVNSKNATLKSIGKAAAVADITIKTAQSAMNAFQGFSSIPYVGIPLGLAAAGAVIAFGAEQIGSVLGAAQGGVVPGFNRGGDGTPALLQPGELITPRQNFDEVISAVAESRANQSVQASAGVGPSPGGGQAGGAFELRFSGDNAEKFLTARRVEARNLGTLRDGVA
ncbi:MAG: hypothetical protein IPO08_20895 [Xanthomonadales bacterium]|nr:hypothetical protein [Xanthomonadales bacterium]